MKRLLVFAVAVSAGTLAFRPDAAAHARPHRIARAPVSLWDSVYTDSQVVIGDSMYKAVCVKCHGPTLAGGDDGNPLTGDQFMSNWNGLSIDGIYDKIRNEMPPDNPKTIPREMVPNVMAFIFSKNGFPSGTKPLTADSAALKAIKFARSKS